ncbi:MAG: glutathione S-transferase family protein [bacterium]|nr:glutathione S-transferase family protein [bacterium]MXV89937.1 glutathione S-transferase family protein [Acidimicrobiia bacterium]MYC44725.1 glutathione S-transferase family protein [Acidimicrobiia bacterium]
MIKLYDYLLSANCYKARLLLSMLDVPHELVPIEFYPRREHESAAFKKINPLGHIPVIDDDGFILRDAHAILMYLACKYDGGRDWYPTGDPRLLGEVASWLQFADGTAATASAARLCINFGYDFDLEACQAGAHRLFRVLDEHVWFREQEGLSWVASAAAPTVADMALFPDVALSEEGGISREDYPALRRWTERIQRLGGFIDMPGVLPVAPLPS